MPCLHQIDADEVLFIILETTHGTCLAVIKDTSFSFFKRPKSSNSPDSRASSHFDSSSSLCKKNHKENCIIKRNK